MAMMAISFFMVIVGSCSVPVGPDSSQSYSTEIALQKIEAIIMNVFVKMVSIHGEDTRTTHDITMENQESPNGPEEQNPEKRHFESVRDAVCSGRDDAREKAKEAAPKVKSKLKSTVAEAVFDVAYGAAYGAFFAGAFANEFIPDEIKDGLAKGANAGRSAARQAGEKARQAGEKAREMMATPPETPAAGPLGEVIDVGGEPAGA